jgi:hypothetical protein
MSSNRGFCVSLEKTLRQEISYPDGIWLSIHIFMYTLTLGSINLYLRIGGTGQLFMRSILGSLSFWGSVFFFS